MEQSNRFSVLEIETDNSEKELELEKKFAWVKNIGHSIIKSVEINGVVVYENKNDNTEFTKTFQELANEKISVTNEEEKLTEKETIKDKINKLDLGDVRKNYQYYVSIYGKHLNKTFLSRLWDSWENSTKLDIDETLRSKLTKLKEFIFNLNEKTLCIKNLSPKHRYEYHQLCSILKLEHRSIENIVETKEEKSKIVEKENDNEWSVIKTKKTKKIENKKKRNNEYNKWYSEELKKKKSEQKCNGITNEIQINSKRETDRKTLIITKPTNWSWEFTIVSEEQDKLDKEKILASQRKREKNFNSSNKTKLS